MSAWLVSKHTVGGTAVRAAGHALAATVLATGLHHATTDSRVSWPAVALAAAVLAVCAYAVLREGAPLGRGRPWPPCRPCCPATWS
ncbi:hypothetical protein ACH40E_17640 [Streptomyces acidicola]|uniref:hypothetical protein n=1 Tax=Streptomyces acidicola TaxID=2596892 RepID=UPI00378BCBFE